MIRDILKRLLYGEKEREARNGEYQNVFCPHCGEWIPNKFRVAHEGLVEAPMAFDCPNCDRSGIVAEGKKIEVGVGPLRPDIGGDIDRLQDE